VWLRRLGLVTVRHADTNPFVAVDRAAARLRQAIARRIAAPAIVGPPVSAPTNSGDNEGGRLKPAGKAAELPAKHRTRRRYRHVDSEYSPDSARHAKARQAPSSRHADNGVSGFRSHPSRMAHA
jgi:hypothetical protein